MTDNSALIDEVLRIEEDALYTGQANFVMAECYERLHMRLGIPTVLLSAAAGATIVSDSSKVAAAILAFIASLLAALHTFINPDRRASEHAVLGTEYGDLEASARRLRTIDLDHLSFPEARLRLEALATERTKLNRRNHTTEGAFKEAQKKIASGDLAHRPDLDSGASAPRRPSNAN